MPTEQQQINYGNTANDGQGDPLRTAFIKVDDNFDAIWKAGPVGSNVTIVNNTVSTVNANGNLAIRANGVGVIETSSTLLPRLANSYDLGSANLRYRAAYIGSGGANVSGNLRVTGSTTLANDVTVGGNLTVDGDVIQLGNITTDSKTIQLANTAATDAAADGSGVTVGANDDIATMLYDSITDAWVTNIDLEVTGNVAADYFVGNGSQLTGLSAGYANADAVSYAESGWAGNIIPAANATYSLGNSTNYWSNLWVANNTIYIGGVPLGVTGNTLTVDGQPVLSNDSASNIATTGNITANAILTDNYFYANGEPFVSSSTGNITFSNTTMSPPDGEDLFITAANAEVEITGLDFRVEVTDDVRIQGNDIVSIRNTSDVDPITIITDYNGIARTWEFDATGNLRTPGNIEVSGDITVAGDISGTSSASTLVLAAEPNSNTAIQLNDSVASVVRTVANLEIRTDSSNTAKTWTFDTTGDLSAPGNITSGNILTDNYFYANGAPFTPGSNYGDSNVVSLLSAFGSNSITTTGNVTADNFTGSGTDIELVAGSYTWTFDNAGNLSLPGNTFAVNYANGTAVTLGGDYGDSNVVTLLSDLGSNAISTTGNITAANFIGNVTLTGNITGSSANVELAANAYVWTFDNTGNTTFANGTVSANDITLTGNISANTAGYAIGYRDIPQISFTGNATIATTDAGKHYYSTESTDYILTIANNASEGFQVGTAISIVNQGTGNITIAQGSGVSLYLAGNATASNRTLSTFGMATIMKVDTDTWFINGTGVS